MNTIIQIALSVLHGIYGAESSHGKNPKAWQHGWMGAGPLQITKIMADDYNQHILPAGRFVWPDDFLDRKTGLSASCIVYLWFNEWYSAYHLKKTGRLLTNRQIALAWKYGYKGCIRSGWADPEGYWRKVQQRNKKKSN